MILLGGFSVYRLQEVNSIAAEINENWLPSALHLSDMNTNTSDFRVAELQHILSTDPKEMANYEKDMAQVIANFNKNNEAYKKLISSSEEQKLYDDFSAKWKAYLAEHDKILELSRVNRNEEAKALIRGKSQEYFDDFSGKLLTMIELNTKGGVEAGKRGDEVYKSSRLLIIGLLIGAVLIGMLAGIFISNTISKPINEAVETAQRLSVGELSAEMTVKSTDETGQLISSMNKMTNYLREMSSVADSIAQGDLSKNIDPKSSRDVFGIAFRRMTENLRMMASVAEKIADGNLNVKVEAQSSVDAFGNAFKGMIDNLRKMSRVAEAIAKGNLAVEIQPKSEADAFGTTFKNMLESLRNIVKELNENSQILSTSAEELVAVATNQSAVITQQASAIQEITTTLDEIRATVEQASDRAKSVAHISEQSLEISKAGQQELEQVVGAMSNIKDQVENIAENILDLSEKTIQIGEITSSVNDIAEQSNLLAVNAAIEATKAGEAGKGFGVVAVEVKNLAARSKKATTQVRSILAEIQKAANSTVMVTEEGSKKVDNGVDQVYRIGNNIKNLHEVIVESSTAAKQIAYASTQQVTGIEQISIAMKQINQGTNESVASARQQKATAQNLSQLASSLTSIVQRYQL
jgi:methyl-accepting chemotaxis protein